MKTKKDIVLKEEEGEGILFEQDTGRISILNHTGMIIMKMLEKGSDQQALANGVKAVYKDASKEKIETDVKNFLTQVRNRRLLA